MSKKEFYTTGEAARYLGMSKNGVIYLLMSGKLKYHWNGRRRFVSESDLKKHKGEK